MTSATESAVPPDPKSTRERAIEMRPGGVANGRVRPPGSKSITNRAIVIAALATGQSKLIGALDSEDTQVMIEAWRQLGIPIEHDLQSSIIQLTGCDGKIPVPHAQLFLANSGTSMRVLTAAVALGHGDFRLDGVARMRQRPIEGLLAAIRSLGADAQSELGTGCPPVKVQASGLRGGHVKIGGGESSQYASALLMAAP